MPGPDGETGSGSSRTRGLLPGAGRAGRTPVARGQAGKLHGTTGHGTGEPARRAEVFAGTGTAAGRHTAGREAGRAGPAPVCRPVPVLVSSWLYARRASLPGAGAGKTRGRGNFAASQGPVRGSRTGLRPG